MKLLSLVSAIFCFGLLHIQPASSYAQSKTSQYFQKIIDKRILPEMDENFRQIPGFIIGIIHQDSVFKYGYGTFAQQDSLGHLIFEMGGLSKVFTATLLEACAQAGDLNYQTSINNYLPKNQTNKYLEKITLLQLVTHTSGLPKLPSGFGQKEKLLHNPYALYTTQDLMAFYQDFETDLSFSNKYIYSHLNYALIQYILEQRYQKPLAQLWVEKIAQPLALNDTQIELSEAQKRHFAQGYAISGKPTAAWQFSSFEGAEGMKSSLNDLIKWINFYFKPEANPLVNIFSEMTNPAFHTLLDKKTDVTKGWHIIREKKYDIVAFSGNTSGHSAFVGMVEKSKTAVVVLANSPHRVNLLGYILLQSIQ